MSIKKDFEAEIELEEGLENEELGTEELESENGQRVSDSATFKKLKEKLSGSEDKISDILVAVEYSNVSIVVYFKPVSVSASGVAIKCLIASLLNGPTMLS